MSKKKAKVKIRNTKIPTFYLLLVLTSVALFVFFEWIKPREVSWDETYAPSDEMPYGTYVLFNQLQDFFPNSTIDQNSMNYYDLLHASDSNKTLIIINHSFYTDKYSIDVILDYVSKGNEVFISADYFETYLQDTLNFSVSHSFLRTSESRKFVIDGDTIETTLMRKGEAGFYNNFEETDSSEFISLSKSMVDQVNFIKFKIGDGTLYLHSAPNIFTNYYILKGMTTELAEKTISFLAVRDVIWDDYIRRKEFVNRSDLSFIATSPALRSAYFITLFLLVLFMLFYGKRRQKMIPVVTPLENSSLEFAETISGLYLQQNKHKDIAEKQIRFFEDYIRLRFHLQTDFKSEKFKKLLAQRAGKESILVDEISAYIYSLKSKDDVSSAELFALNKKIEDFKKQ